MSRRYLSTPHYLSEGNDDLPEIPVRTLDQWSLEELDEHLQFMQQLESEHILLLGVMARTYLTPLEGIVTRFEYIRVRKSGMR